MARTSRASRPRSGRSPRTRTSARTGVVELFTYPQRHIAWRILGLVVRLRAELTVLAVLLAARFWLWPRLVESIGHTAALLTTTALILGVLVVPASRRFLNRRWWSVTTRHRIRACYQQTRTMTHHGRLPLLVWSRPSPVGERVRVWLPAGLSVKDLERVTEETAAACWASEVRITPSRRQAALVVVDVIRRDPLTGGALTPQVLDDLDPDDPTWDVPDEDTPTVTDRTGATGGTVVPLPSRTTLPAPDAEPADPVATGTDGPGSTTGSNGTGSTGTRARTRKNPAPAGTAGTENTGEPPVTGFGGVDVSDYV